MNLRDLFLACGGSPDQFARIDALKARRNKIPDLTAGEDLAALPHLFELAEDDSKTPEDVLQAIEAHVQRLEASRRN